MLHSSLSDSQKLSLKFFFSDLPSGYDIFSLAKAKLFSQIQHSEELCAPDSALFCDPE